MHLHWHCHHESIIAVIVVSLGAVFAFFHRYLLLPVLCLLQKSIPKSKFISLVCWSALLARLPLLLVKPCAAICLRCSVSHMPNSFRCSYCPVLQCKNLWAGLTRPRTVDLRLHAVSSRVPLFLVKIAGLRPVSQNCTFYDIKMKWR